MIDLDFDGAGEKRNISAIVAWGKHAFIASDEATKSHRNYLQMFKRIGRYFTAPENSVIELDAAEALVNDGEDTLPKMDLEGLSVEGNR